MERIYPIFVPDESINENKLEYSDVVQWCYNNLTHPNVLIFKLNDIYFLQYNTKILDIINEENGGFIQEGENDWIISNEVKIRVQERLKKYRENENIGEKEKAIIDSILLLIEISIRTSKNLYFLF